MSRTMHFILLASLLIVIGCASRGEIVAFQEDMRYLRHGLGQIQLGQQDQDSLLVGRVEVLKERLLETEVVLRRLKADQQQGMDELRGLIEELRLTLEESGTYNRRLQQKMDELNLILARQGLRQERDSLAGADPEWLYNQANLDRMRGLPDLARSGFREYLARFPEASMSGWSSYWIADTWLSEQQMDSAFVQYENFLLIHPTHEKAASARLHRARILAAQGRPDDARQELDALISLYPDSHEALLAGEQLKELQTEAGDSGKGNQKDN
jgi:TolA-binding protein